MWATPSPTPSINSWETPGNIPTNSNPVVTWTTATQSQALWVLRFPKDPEREDAYKQYLEWTRGNRIVNIISSQIDPKTIYLMPNDERWIFLDKIMRELVQAWGWICNIAQTTVHPQYGEWNYVSTTDRWNTSLKRWFVTHKDMHLDTKILGLDRAQTGRPRGWAGYLWTPEERWHY